MNRQHSSNLLPTVFVIILFAIVATVGWLIWRLPSAAERQSASTAPQRSLVILLPVLPPGVVYEADFVKGAGPEWSETRTSWTPDPRKAFLGPFRDEPVELRVNGLPPHQFINLKFDLITYQRWNGDSGEWGRDLWDMRVANGQPLIHTTFSDCGFFTNNNEQSFPDQYPWYPTHEGWTGAKEKQSLGYMTSQGPESWGDDSTYAIDITFPHAGNSVGIVFKSLIKSHENKPYGFLSFKITTIDHASNADEPTLAGWWKDLSDEDSLKAYHAVWSLVATGDAATNYIHDHLSPAAAGPHAPPVNIDQDEVWDYGSFQYDTSAARQRARAIHVLEVINSSAANALLGEIGFQGTPIAAPPDRWGNGN